MPKKPTLREKTKPRGRPKGSGIGPRGPQAGAWAAWLLAFEVGERQYIETSLDEYTALMKNILKPAYLKIYPEFSDRRYSGNMCTATTRVLGDVRYLLCVEREA